MTTIIRFQAPDQHRVQGFTLVEVLISATLGSLVLMAVMAAFLFLGRSGANMQNYVDMEAQARRAIETFAEDVRMSSGATWNTSNSLTLTVVTASGTVSRTYTYNSTAGTFTRTASGSTTTLLTGISTFSFTAYKINTDTIDLSDSSTLTDASNLTKQIQISLRTIRSTRTVTDATNSVISARFILRNKNITA
jgi:prepilin-type N-terminal cleavage/methylation domain-containing protein